MGGIVSRVSQLSNVCASGVRFVDPPNLENKSYYFGHMIRVTIKAIDLKNCSLEWWEFTDKPYVDGMDAMTWVDMYGMNAASPVFARWNTATYPRSVGGYKATEILDPASIWYKKKDVEEFNENERTLFIVPVVHLTDGSSRYCVIKQVLKYKDVTDKARERREIEGRQYNIRGRQYNITEHELTIISHKHRAINESIVVSAMGAPGLPVCAHGNLPAIKRLITP